MNNIINYTINTNKLQTANITNRKKYYYKAVCNKMYDREALVNRIIEMGTSLNKMDISWVIDALKEVSGNIILEGSGIHIDDFISLYPQVKGSTDDPRSDENSPQIDVRSLVSRKFKGKIKQTVRLQSVRTTENTPHIQIVKNAHDDNINETIGSHHYLAIEGTNLKFDPEVEDEGIFLIDEEGKETKLAFTGSLYTNRCTFSVPDISSLSGKEVTLCLRKRNINCKKLLEGKTDYTLKVI